MKASFAALLKKYLEDDLDPAELRTFLNLVAKKEHQQNLLNALDEALAESNSLNRSDEKEIEKMFQLTLLRAASQPAADRAPDSAPAITAVKRRHKRNAMLLLRAAAVIIPLAGLGIFLWLKQTGSIGEQPRAEQAAMFDVEPGGDKAVLTLADGSQIVLDAASDGMLARQTGVEVVKLPGGQLAYRAVGGTANDLVYNTMSTPRGGQYQLHLPDGSRVWLNASSSLRFPVAFTGKERRVSLQGEGYFEVAPNADMPFTVEVNDMEIQVLGTHFNVNAYADEAGTTTTLLEGKVRVRTAKADGLLRPGQQARLTSSGAVEILSTPNQEEVMAWKNGLFFFEGADLPSIMRQLARWYDLEVYYENGKLPKRRFNGQVYRNLKLSEVLKVLELSDVHFRLEGRKLIVVS